MNKPSHYHYIIFLVLYSFITGFCIPINTCSQIVTDGYTVESILPVGDLLSGITNYQDEILVCEYDRNRILRISLDGTVDVFLNGLQTPVDVEIVGETVWVLLQEPGELVEVNLVTGKRRTLVRGLLEPTAMAVSGNDLVYITEFFTGQLLEIEIDTGIQRVINNTLSNPADIVILPNGELYVAEQVGLDFVEGGVLGFPEDSRAPTRENTVVDASGITVRSDGSVLISSFLIPECGMGGVVSINEMGLQETVLCNLNGPTSLTTLPNGWIAVIEEVTNSIVLIFPDGSHQYLIRGIPSISGFDIFPDGEIVLVQNTPDNTVTLLHSNLPLIQNAERLVASFSLPMIEVGGDGNLYIYNPLFRETSVYSRNGELLRIIDTPFAVNRMLNDPTGGIAFIVNQGRESQMVRVNQRGNRIVEPIGMDANTAFILPNGDIGNLTVSGSDFAAQTTLLLVVENQEQIWYTEKNSTELYLQSGLSHQKIAQFNDPIINIEKNNSNGVLVGTASGNLLWVYALSEIELDAALPFPSLPPAETAVKNWLYEYE